MTAPVWPLPVSRRTPKPAALRYAMIRPRSGTNWLVGILRRDPALDGEAPARDRLLAGDADLGVGEGVPFGDADLRLHDIDAGDQLRDGMLHLDARVDFEEVEVAVGVVEELDRRRR